MENKTIYLEDLPLEDQVDILVDTKQFWEYFHEVSSDDCSLECILRHNGITDENIIAEQKVISQRRLEARSERYNLIFTD